MYQPSKLSGVALRLLEIQPDANKPRGRGWQREMAADGITRGRWRRCCIPHSESSFWALALSSQSGRGRSSAPASSRWPPWPCASAAGTGPAAAGGGFRLRWGICHRLSRASSLSDAALKTGCLHHRFLLLLLQRAMKRCSHTDLLALAFHRDGQVAATNWSKHTGWRWNYLLRHILTC